MRPSRGYWLGDPWRPPMATVERQGRTTHETSPMPRKSGLEPL
jgi:hypothetical protein